LPDPALKCCVKSVPSYTAGLASIDKPQYSSPAAQVLRTRAESSRLEPDYCATAFYENVGLQVDAYSGYDQLYEDPECNVVEVACWAHARRKFYEAQSSDVMRSMVLLACIRLLYEIAISEARNAARCARRGPFPFSMTYVPI